ncbi:MepB family protein [Pedobacter sp. JY14-1]|uniref:MepB family protein n=1 Tax=Pedobacter sp. JY14-1 TaxID=3034151 RepID=UPI0023E2EE00|nr:MepB family protein [Pedobacter sp. JY14-1]
MFDGICRLSGLIASPYLPDTHAKAYEGKKFTCDGRSIIYRTGKLTPRKAGHFIAIWEKTSDGGSRPLSFEDQLSDLLIAVEEGGRMGYFLFPADVLLQRGIAASSSNQGKRGLRVYAPWISGLNPTALATQGWQQEYFREISGRTVVKRV